VAIGQPLPTGTGIAIVGNSDALSVMAANALSGTGLTQARPPATFARQESADAYASAIRAAFEDAAVGAVLAIYVPPIEHRSDAEIRAALRACAGAASSHGKPIVAVMLSEPGPPAPDDVPAFGDVEAAVRALSAVARHAQWRRVDAARREAAAAAPERQPERHDGGLPLGTAQGESAADGLRRAGLLAVRLRAGDTPLLGCRIRLLDDPLFGPVVSVGVDDPVAEELDDRSYRLAPVAVSAALEMQASLGALPVLVRDLADPRSALDGLAQAIADVSLLPSRADGVTAADLRHAALTDGSLTVAGISVTVSQGVVAPHPTARRL